MPLDAPTPGNVLKSDSAGFSADVLASDVPVLVDFWAAWCGPCRALAPHLDTLATRFAGKAKVIKVNADENPDVAARYGVRGLPTLLVFKGGKVVDQLVGNPGSAKPLEQLVQRNL
jgi:thioredoxin 1